MLIGLAIGDSLGNTCESMTPSARRAAHGEVRGYLPNKHVRCRAVGLPSDDTQLTAWTLECLLEDGGVVPEHIADAICYGGEIYGIGSTVKEFIKNYKAGMAWYECGPHSAGNGAIMRIAPIILPHLRNPSPWLWTDTAVCASITHNDVASNAACIAWIDLLWNALHMKSAPDSLFWPSRYVAVAGQLEGDPSCSASGPWAAGAITGAAHAPAYRSRSPHYPDWRGTLAGFVSATLPSMYADRVAVIDACNRIQSGAYLLETIPCVLYILMNHAQDPIEAVVRAVNDTWDNDTIAGLVGSMVGAIHGLSAFPKPWVYSLLGRTRADDDGHLFRLVCDAISRWMS
ncbi:MAG: ADP-ribosylglycohydrolase family protein [Firmicutes bacterium]|nr:ADP-ribosylglycohydrolase family protein [Bacillota bacterium]